MRKVADGYEIEFNSFVSDRLSQKIDEYNQKKGMSDKSTLFDSENGEEDDESEVEEKPKKKTLLVFLRKTMKLPLLHGVRSRRER